MVFGNFTQGQLGSIAELATLALHMIVRLAPWALALGFIALPGCTSDLADAFGGVSSERDAGPGPRPDQEPEGLTVEPQPAPEPETTPEPATAERDSGPTPEPTTVPEPDDMPVEPTDPPEPVAADDDMPMPEPTAEPAAEPEPSVEQMEDAGTPPEPVDTDASVAEPEPVEPLDAGFQSDATVAMPEPVPEPVPQPEPVPEPEPEPFALTTLLPTAGSVDADPSTHLKLTFNRAVTLGTGNVEITNLTTGRPFASVPLDDLQVSVAASEVTIDLDGILAELNDYSVNVPATAISDGAGATFAGLSGSDWTFTTASVATPGGVPAADLLLWYDAQLAASFKQGSGGIRLWGDRSGNNLNLTQNTSAEQPARVDAALGGQAVVRFDGASMFTGPDLDDPDGYELFAVWQSPVLPGTELSLIFSNGVLELPNVQVIYGHSVEGYANSGLSYFDDYLPLAFAPAVANTPTLWNVGFVAGTGMATYTNGTLVASDNTMTDPLPDPVEAITVGGFDGDFFFEGDVAELIYFSRGLSAQERSAVGAYVEERWGIDVAP